MCDACKEKARKEKNKRYREREIKASAAEARRITEEDIPRVSLKYIMGFTEGKLQKHLESITRREVIPTW